MQPFGIPGLIRIPMGVYQWQRSGPGADSPVAIWPGVPTDLPAAVEFFAACGRRAIHDTLDLVADLRVTARPQERAGGPAQLLVTIAPAAPGEFGPVLDVEIAAFPNWARRSRAGDRDIPSGRRYSPHVRDHNQ